MASWPTVDYQADIRASGLRRLLPWDDKHGELQKPRSIVSASDYPAPSSTVNYIGLNGVLMGMMPVALFRLCKDAHQPPIHL
jgi:hypothetical protein